MLLEHEQKMDRVEARLAYLRDAQRALIAQAKVSASKERVA